MKRNEIIKGGIVEEFISWFHSRGEHYAKLPVKFYQDNEPYFSYRGVECSLRDYLEFQKFKVGDKIIATYLSGGGQEYDEGKQLK